MHQSDKDIAIYFHVGLGKVASTYLQYRVFPKLLGVYYIQRTRYRRYHKIISKTNYGKYFLSREFDQQLESELEKFSKHYPHAKIIILFRRHDGWIASQYRRYIKNGGAKSFDGFFDIDQDNGLWKQNDLYFYPKIKVAEKYFANKPLVLFHEELKKDPFQFIDKFAKYIGATFEKEDISLKPIHRSYNEKQLKVIHRISKMIFKREPKWVENRLVRWFQRRSRLLVCYLILYPAKLIPAFLVSKQKLIPDGQLKKIREFYADDWQQCLEYGAGEKGYLR